MKLGKLEERLETKLGKLEERLETKLGKLEERLEMKLGKLEERLETKLGKPMTTAWTGFRGLTDEDDCLLEFDQQGTEEPRLAIFK